MAISSDSDKLQLANCGQKQPVVIQAIRKKSFRFFFYKCVLCHGCSLKQHA